MRRLSQAFLGVHVEIHTQPQKPKVLVRVQLFLILFSVAYLLLQTTHCYGERPACPCTFLLSPFSFLRVLAAIRLQSEAAP